MAGSYNYSQLEQLWINAGGSPTLAPVMAAIAMAESGGNPDALDYDSNGTVDRGLWQINSAWGPLSTTDPTANAQAAVDVQKQQGLGAWVTYNTGKYQAYLEGGNPVTTPTTAQLTDSVTPGTTIPGATGSSSTSQMPSANPSDALNEAKELFHGIASGLNWFFWLFQPGQGYRFLFGVGGIASAIGAIKLYMSPNVNQEKSSAFPLAILLTGTSFFCFYVTMRAWPVGTNGKAYRPANYLVLIITGHTPPAGPPVSDNTDAIQIGLEAFAAVWLVSKGVSAVSGLAGAAGVLGTIWNSLKGALGKLGGGAGGAGGAPVPEIPDIPVASLTVPNVPGLQSGA